MEHVKKLNKLEETALNSLEDEQKWLRTFNEFADFAIKGHRNATKTTELARKSVIDRTNSIRSSVEQGRRMGWSLVEALLTEPNRAEGLFNRMASKSTIPISYVLDFAKSEIQANRNFSQAEKDPLIHILSTWQERLPSPDKG